MRLLLPSLEIDVANDRGGTGSRKYEEVFPKEISHDQGDSRSDSVASRFPQEELGCSLQCGKGEEWKLDKMRFLHFGGTRAW